MPSVLCAEIRVPESDRSRAAIARVRPRLEASLRRDGLRWGSPVFLRIFKRESELELWVKSGSRFKLFRTYEICRYSGNLGPKEREGDWQAPEGFYFVPPRAMNPASNYHLSFDIGYPNSYDRAMGRTGSAIMVHGSCVSVGCFAMTDEKIEEIYALCDAALRSGQPFFRVHVFPFKMTDENLRENLGARAIPFFAPSHAKWRDFWTNLKEGYDLFETSRIPPDVRVRDGKYIFIR